MKYSKLVAPVLTVAMVAGGLAAPASAANWNVNQCQDIKNGIMAIESTQGANPVIVGANMQPISSKTKAVVEPTLHVRVKDGSDGVDIPLQWSWGDSMKRYAGLMESAKRINCKITPKNMFVVDAYQEFVGGKTAHEFMDPVFVSLDSHLYNSTFSVPKYISFKEGTIHISPKKVKQPQSAVVNLKIDYGIEFSIFGLKTGKSYLLPIQVTHLPEDSKAPVGIEKETPGSSSKGGSSMGGSPTGGGLFDSLFSFSS